MNHLPATIIGLLLGVLVSFGALQLYNPSKNDKPLPVRPELSSSTALRTLSASGESFVMAKPDVATIRLAVENRGPKLDALTIEINQKSALILQRLRDSGILEKDVQSYLEVNPQYTNGGRGVPPRINGYEARNQMNVKIRNVGKVGDTLDAVIAAGANSVESLEWGIEDDEKYKSQARAIAVKLALSKIKSMADAANVDVGNIMSLNEDYSSQQENFELKARVSEVQTQSAPVEAGMIKISSRVSVVAEIK